MKHSDNETLDAMVAAAVASLEATGDATGFVKYVKLAPTGILLADGSHIKWRYKPGNQLVTYNGIDENGQPMQETWGGGVATLSSESVILRNQKPITYLKGHPLAGMPVQGDYDLKGKFSVDQEDGLEVLFNEYVSDIDFVKGAYGVIATNRWKQATKLVPSFALQIPEEMGEVSVITTGDVVESLKGGDFVVIDYNVKKKKVTSVHGVEQSWMIGDNATYAKLDDLIANQH